MSKPNFVHLHLHTHYSLLDGATEIKKLVAKAKAAGMPAVAVTDHGNLFGAIEFYTAARAAGIKPIIGMEAYLAPQQRDNTQAKCAGGDHSYHLLLLAQNLAGYHNLLKLSSIGYLQGFYYKPRIDKEVLAEFSEGLICTSTCLGAELPQTLLHRDFKQAVQVAEKYLDIFGPERFFIEVQDHGIPEQHETNPALFDIAQKLGLGVVVTNDVHYLDADDVEAHDVLCCISTNSRLSDEKRFKFPSDQFYFKSADEMAELFPDRPEVMQNTLRIADLCNVELDFSKRCAPVYHPPDKKTDSDYLRELVEEGALARYGSINDTVRKRIDYELEVICSKGFC
ncbi:MAG: PHP domain-containing protein, partial [Planctomycetes bacterium]|nr:PHP domain-containing protein [Planctomycetota bacterium]